MNDLKTQIIEALESQGGLLTQSELKAKVAADDLNFLNSVNELVGGAQITIFENKDKQLCYKLQSAEEIERRKNLSVEEEIILQHVQAAGANGITVSELKGKCGMTSTNINKHLAKLHRKSIVKTLKSASARQKKLWFLESVEPIEEHTGLWIQDDYILVETLYQKILEYARENKQTKPKQIYPYLRSLSLTNKNLRDQDLRQIFELLVIDGKIEEGDDGYFRPSEWYYPKPAVAISPCTLCPLTQECKPGSSVISPEKCKYLEEWIQF